MSPIGSLRGRVWIGAILWTIGLFALAGVLLTQVMNFHPDSPVVVHRVFLHVGPISVFALLLLLVGLIQVTRGVSPIAQLRHRLSAIRGGHTKRVDGKFPSEVQPSSMISTHCWRHATASWSARRPKQETWRMDSRHRWRYS